MTRNVSDKPSAPQNLTVTEITAGSATITWKASEFDGGSSIDTYVIEKQDSKRTTWMNVGTVRVSLAQIYVHIIYVVYGLVFLLVFTRITSFTSNQQGIVKSYNVLLNVYMCIIILFTKT